jgi:hypothetical protein
MDGGYELRNDIFGFMKSRKLSEWLRICYLLTEHPPLLSY